jgi:hypothetical protein
MAAVDWPDLDELKRVLDVEGSDWDDHLEIQLTAAIDKVKADVGDWDDATDTPTPNLTKAALRAAVLLQANAADPQLVDTDEVYAGHLKGARRVFGFG